MPVLKDYDTMVNHLVGHITDPKEPVDSKDFTQAKRFIGRIKGIKSRKNNIMPVKFMKGSDEMKEHMAKLRGMRKPKSKGKGLGAGIGCGLEGLAGNGILNKPKQPLVGIRTMKLRWIMASRFVVVDSVLESLFINTIITLHPKPWKAEISVQCLNPLDARQSSLSNMTYQLLVSIKVFQ